VDDRLLVIVDQSRDDLFTTQMLAMKPAAALAFFTAMVREFCTRLAATDDLVSEVTRWGLEATGLEGDVTGTA